MFFLSRNLLPILLILHQTFPSITCLCRDTRGCALPPPIYQSPCQPAPRNSTYFTIITISDNGYLLAFSVDKNCTTTLATLALNPSMISEGSLSTPLTNPIDGGIPTEYYATWSSFSFAISSSANFTLAAQVLANLCNVIAISGTLEYDLSSTGCSRMGLPSIMAAPVFYNVAQMGYSAAYFGYYPNGYDTPTVANRTTMMDPTPYVNVNLSSSPASALQFSPPAAAAAWLIGGFLIAFLI